MQLLRTSVFPAFRGGDDAIETLVDSLPLSASPPAPLGTPPHFARGAGPLFMRTAAAEELQQQKLAPTIEGVVIPPMFTVVPATTLSRTALRLKESSCLVLGPALAESLSLELQSTSSARCCLQLFCVFFLHFSHSAVVVACPRGVLL